MKALIYVSKRTLYIFFCFVIILAGCKKDIKESIPVTVKDGVPPFPLSWETSDYMPTPPGTTILVPWANGSVKGFSSYLWYDYKKTDGWELVYNTFNTSALPANPWFVLYNKYRGLIRIYVYVTTNGFTNSDYLTSGLNLDPNLVSTPMLNYIGQDIVDVTQNKSVAIKIEPTQMASGTWYASQYEIAYDPNIPTATYQQLGLNWMLKWTSVSQVSLGGDIIGSVTGTITSPASGFNLLGNMQQGVLEATGAAIFDNNIGTNASNPGEHNKLGLPSLVFNAAREGLTSGLNGVVKNMFSAIFGGNSANTQEVNLSINAKITLNGTSTSSGALFPNPGLGLGIPGISNSQSAAGYIPGYNLPMGVFYISNRPKVKITSIQSTPPPNWDGLPRYYYLNNFNIDPTSFTILTNNQVLNGIATTSIVLESIFLLEHVVDPTNHYYAYPKYTELVGQNTYYDATATTIDGNKINTGLGLAVVRIVLKVTPNNTSVPPSTIVKTFLADLVN